MARFAFDFHAAPRRPGLPGLALALAGALALGLSVHGWGNARDTHAGLALRIADATQPRPLAKPRSVPADVAAREAGARIAAQLAYRWQPAFDALAAAQDGTIALVALDANQAKARLKLTAEARALAHAIAWIERLQAQPGVIRAALVQHEIQAEAPQKPVRVVVEVALAP